MKDYYQELGIGADATEEAIKKAYRTLAKQYHPDKNHQAETHDRFVAIAEAYNVLIDPDQRRNYDRKRVGMPADDALMRMADAFAKAQEVARARAEAEYQRRQQLWDEKQEEERKWGRMIDVTARIGFAIILFLAIDLIGTRSMQPATILRKQIFLDKDLFLITTAEDKYTVNGDDAIYILTGWMIQEKKTLLLSQRLKLEAFPAYDTTKRTALGERANFYKPFFFFPALMAFCIIGAFFHRKLPRPVQGLMFAVASWTFGGMSLMVWLIFG